jgi:hypothetical protein
MNSSSLNSSKLETNAFYLLEELLDCFLFWKFSTCTQQSSLRDYTWNSMAFYGL